MASLSKKQRVLNTFEYGELDRYAIYDKIHDIDLIEHTAGEKITEKNAEDVTCRALGKLCDMVRHVAIPYTLDEHIKKDEDGFVYRVKWYTKDIIDRPFKTEAEAMDIVKSDIEKINLAIDNKRFCPQASWNLKLFGEDLTDPEELNHEFRRIQEKMDGAVMVAPEFFDGIGPLSTRYDYTNFVYLYNDHPELIRDLLDVYIDYQLFRIEAFDSSLTPVALAGTAVSGTGGLIFSPDFIRKEYFPRMRKLYRKLKQKGYHVIVESEGDNRIIFDDFIKMGIEAYTPVEHASRMHIEDIKEKYPKLVICQEIDSMQLLTFGSVDEVVAETKKIKTIAGQYGGVFIGSCGDIHEKVSIENALAMYETVRKPG